MASPQQTRFGQWEREAILGKGAFGMVTLWKNLTTNKRIAIKKLNLIGRNDNWKTEVKFIREADHPNIVGYREIPPDLAGEFPAINSLGMEYCTKGDLRKFLAQSEFCCGLLESLVRNMLSDVSSAICYLHEKNSMHRDLKPENIVLQYLQPNDRIHFKVTDLGYAKELNEHSFGRSYVGTQFYLAPEIATQPRDELHYMKSVDYWSFGLLSFECITGYRPFCPNFEQLALPYVLKKTNEDISIIVEKDPNNSGQIKHVRYKKSIPEPNNLNRLFAKDLTFWLQSMLHINSDSRGGGSYQQWFSHLKGCLSKKYIEVVNTITMDIITFEVNEQQTIVFVVNQLANRTGIPVAELLLLKRNGEEPDVMGTIAQSLPCKNENLYEVFLFHSTQKVTDLRNVSVPLPSYLENVCSKNHTEAYGNERHYVAFAYDFIVKRYTWLKTIMAALYSLVLSNIKQGGTLQEIVLRNLETNLSKLQIKKDVMKEIFQNHVVDFERLQNQHEFEDSTLDNLVSEANTELVQCDVLIANLTEKVQTTRNKVSKCRADVERAQEHIKACSKWNIDGVKSEFERKKREVKEAKKNKISVVATFINEKTVVVNDDANNMIRRMQDLIMNLCHSHNDISSNIDTIKALQPEIEDALIFPAQEKLRHGVWRGLRSLAEAQYRINAVDTDQSYAATQELSKSVSNLLSVKFPSLPDLDNELITLY